MSRVPLFIGLTLDTWTGMVVGIVASVATSYVFYRKQRVAKMLAYAIDRNRPVRSGAISGTNLVVKVFLSESDTELQNPAIFDIRVANTGKRGLKGEDFERPITVVVTEGTIQYARVTGTSDPGVCDRSQLNIAHDKRSAELTPTSLNRGDWLDIQVVTEGSQDVLLSTRIFEETRPMGRRDDILRQPLAPVARNIYAWLSGTITGRVVALILTSLMSLAFIIGYLMSR